MKKLSLILVILMLVCSLLCAADVQLHGYITAMYKFEFMEGMPRSRSYGIEGSVFEFTVELNKLSLSRKGETKPYVDLGVSASLAFKVDGGLIYWGTYGYKIPGTALNGSLTINKLNIVGDFLEDEYVVDLIHNKIGGDWAKSGLSNYCYTKYTGDSKSEEDILHKLSFIVAPETPMTYNNRIGEFARYNPGVTVTWRDWSIGVGLNGMDMDEGHATDMTFGITTPEFKFDDSQGSVKFALEAITEKYLATSVEIGGSVKASWVRDRLNIALESDFSWSFMVRDGKYSDPSFDADMHFLAEAGVVSLEFYFTTLTPLLGYRFNVTEVYPAETEMIDLVLMKYYSDARISFDFGKSQDKPVPIKVYATAYDMFVSRDDELRTGPYEEVITGDHGRFTPFEEFVEKRYGRDLDFDFETDAFEEENISKIHIFAHKLLQTIQIGSSLEFKFDYLTLGIDGSYDFTKEEIFGKVSSEFSTQDIRVYAAGLVLVFRDSPVIEKPVIFGCVAGLSSDTFIDFATVGMEFRWDMFSAYSSAPSIFRDFTVYCTVDF